MPVNTARVHLYKKKRFGWCLKRAGLQVFPLLLGLIQADASTDIPSMKLLLHDSGVVVILESLLFSTVDKVCEMFDRYRTQCSALFTLQTLFFFQPSSASTIPMSKGPHRTLNPLSPSKGAACRLRHSPSSSPHQPFIPKPNLFNFKTQQRYSLLHMFSLLCPIHFVPLVFVCIRITDMHRYMLPI